MTTQPTTKAHNLALIVPSPILSETTTTDINREIDRQLERMTDRTTRPIMIRIMSGSNYKHLLHAAKRFDNITIKIHKPNYRNGKPAHNATAKLRAAGNMIAASDYLMVLDGETRAISPTDNDLMNLARKSQIKIINRQIEITPPTPTPEKDQPKKSRPPLLIAEYRVNLNQFTSGARRWETLQDCMDDPIVSHPIAAIYCGRAHKARKAERSPLANPYTQKNSLDPIADFNRYLWTKIKDNDQEIMAALRRITPATPLICYCDHYKACHTDVIRKAASYIAQQDAIKRAQEKRAQRAATSHADANNATVILKDLKKQRETLRQQLAQLDTAIRKAEEQQLTTRPQAG